MRSKCTGTSRVLLIAWSSFRHLSSARFSCLIACAFIIKSAKLFSRLRLIIDCVISSQLLVSNFCEILHSIEDSLRFNLVSGKLISSASHVNRLTFVLICENDFPRVNFTRKTAKKIEANRIAFSCLIHHLLLTPVC